MNKFEWDENRRLGNFEKHHIDFIDVVAVFDDRKRIEYLVERRGEQRYITIGKIHDVVVFVVYTKRGLVKRLISARRASKKERHIYETTT